jgi:chemotaxis signal transduction protein
METLDRDTLNLERASDASTFTSSIYSKINSSSTQDNEAVKRFYYSVGQFNILIEKDLKVENLIDLSINKVPNMPAWCIGIISVRGVIMPVINMHNFLNIEKQDTTKDNFIMLEHKNYTPIVFLTDGLPTTIYFNKYKKSKQLENTPSWVKNHLSNGDVSVFEVDHNLLLQHFTLNN